MANSIGEAFKLLKQIGNMDVVNVNIDRTDDVLSYINHKYKDRVIVPYVAITNNISFMMTKGNRYIITSDNIKCRVVELQEIHICELESLVNELYKMDCWSFIKRWYETKKWMESMHFVYIKLEAI